MTTRTRLTKSVKTELILKSREAALAAVQIFNNPNISFKSEIYTVLMVIAWTYLLHAYYRSRGIDYRYYDQREKRRVYHKTKHGAHKHWELERCINDKECPLDKDTINNLKFLIGLRHEIEHQMTTRIDDTMSARFQATCLNYNESVKNLFGGQYAIDKHLAFSLQFSSLSDEQVSLMRETKGLPGHITQFIEGFDKNLSDQEFNSSRFAYRVLFVAKTANRKGQADRVVEFVKADSPLANQINTNYVLIKETEREKYLPGQIVKTIKDMGFNKFGMHQHTTLWKEKDAKNPVKGFGAEVVGTWYWYDSWLGEVKNHCQVNRKVYTQ